ncbi:MAG TPA: gamma-glutamyltransferase [candidate division Zixibacteria bacterium]|nr:gamma-glutamyltransferase [candidate division Zixibacteria bacterium]MDM7971880.1 gamma-glutamyltransferase [candidate division Zixibacteria bacterium]HOD67691.1 gamma-glutamyltransferase [candidate division Zixibacteria bacterium]HPM36832.1 gamma-glutamyltransferase [candidate division Zixibacteria bacterium]
MRRGGMRRRLGLAAVLLFGVVGPACDGIRVTRLYQEGAAVTAAPLATQVGEEIFRRGGNAFDAAVAIGFALAVVHPQAGNLGGGGFAVIRSAQADTVRTLDFRETAPRAATGGMYLADSVTVIAEASTVGALAAGVPGTVAGLYALWQAYGSMPWEELVRPAALLADKGFPVDAFLANSLRAYEHQLSRFDETREVFFSDGRLPAAGDTLVQPDLAQTLYLIAAQGPEGFYAGQVADSIAATMQKYGGLITREDLAEYRAAWRDPVYFRFDSLDCYSMAPPSSGGLMVGQILKLLEPHSFSGWRPDSPAYMHLFAEAARLAYADRAEYLGDPAFTKAPGNLLDPGYLAQRRLQIDTLHATPSESVSPGLAPAPESDQTTHYSVCDAEGNMVAVTYTINTSYGSALVVGGAGFLLNNEMDDFAIAPGVPNTYGLVGGAANRIEPGKRMLSSMAPLLVLVDGRPFLILGSPGGSRIITTVAQTLLNFTRFKFPLTEALAQARFHHQWLPDTLYVETGGYDAATVRALAGYGHAVKEREAFGDVQAIFIDDRGYMSGASDPRGRGTAGGL